MHNKVKQLKHIMKTIDYKAYFKSYMLESVKNDERDALRGLTESEHAFERDFDGPWYRKAWPDLVDRVEQWLRGLPYDVQIEYRDFQIIELGDSWKRDKCGEGLTEGEKARWVNDWWRNCARALMDLWAEHN